MSDAPRTLILGWGNPGRGDDGLGPALVRLVAEAGFDVDSDYQLQIENAAEIAAYDRVVFVDADRSGPEPFSCHRIAQSNAGLSFSSHSVSPEGVLALAGKLFGHAPESWLVGIRGYEFDAFEVDLSAGARANLTATADFLTEALEKGELVEIGPPRASSCAEPRARGREGKP